MTSSAQVPASLRVYRYRAHDGALCTIVGDGDPPLPESQLIRLARDAISRRTFVAQGASEEDGSELCFVPQNGGCEILSIRANARRRHHGDHRRSLMEILNDLAAALACGRLSFLDDDELRAELPPGEPVLAVQVADSAALASARVEIAAVLDRAGFAAERRDQTVLCVSEATTNALVHGGGYARLCIRRAPGGIRFVIADDGPGLSFFNWMGLDGRDQVSMGYGYHIILDHIDDVSLHTCPAGTTLILDQRVTSTEVTSC